MRTALNGYKEDEVKMATPFLFPDKEESKISTIIVRGSTEGLMDDLERALDDGINTFKALTKDGQLLPGAGATEIELAKQLTSYGEVGRGRERERGREGGRER